MPESRTNCGSCAFAVEQRFNGDASAKASLKNIPTLDAMEVATGKKSVPTTVSLIEDILVDAGPGSHLIVGIHRAPVDGHPIPGHWFNVYYDGQEVHTVDGQTGEVYEFPHDYGGISEWWVMV